MKKHILICNQHGENRGDEAAMRAMLAGFQDGLDDVEFTLLYQFRDRSLRLTFEQEVEDLPIVLPALDYLRLLLFTLLKTIKLDLNFLLSPTLRKIIAAYRKTDLVVSAPGGPYFGDIYANHELLHWLFIYLGSLYKKPIYLYATSAGPFNNKALNLFRRWLYPKFTQLVTREKLSAAHIKKLLGEDTQITITADSAIQQRFSAYPRAQYFDGRENLIDSKLLVAVSLNDYKYPDARDPAVHKQRYDQELKKVLSHLCNHYSAHLLLLPQLYGAAHSDVPYLEKMAAALPPTASWEIVDPAVNSDMQRQIFAMCDIHLASRYHPAIFGNTAMVPGICIYYEHKAQGFMEQLGLEQYAFDIRQPSAAELTAALDEIISNRESLVEHLCERVPELQRRAQQTTQLALKHVSAEA